MVPGGTKPAPGSPRGMLLEVTWPARAGARDRFLRSARTHQIHAARCCVTNTEVEKTGPALGKRKVQLGARTAMDTWTHSDVCQSNEDCY